MHDFRLIPEEVPPIDHHVAERGKTILLDLYGWKGTWEEFVEWIDD